MRKTLKFLLYTCLLLLVLLVIGIPTYISYWRNSATKNTYTSFTEPAHISFCHIKWTSDFLGDEKIEKIAFYVPVKVKGLKGNFFMQFDSGTQTTLFYGKTLNQLLKSPHSIETYYTKDSLRYVRKPIINIGDNELKADKIRIASTLGSATIDSSHIVIGTMGFDAFVNRTLILDFKTDKLAITEKSAHDLSYSMQYVENASVDKFPFIIPAQINGKNTRLFYDTGSSMFSLITSNQRVRDINTDKMDSLCCISHWGEQYPVYRKQLHTPIKIGNYAYENQSVYGCQVVDMVDYVPSWYLYGMTGNRLFDQKIVVIDTENNLFGIVS